MKQGRHATPPQSSSVRAIVAKVRAIDIRVAVQADSQARSILVRAVTIPVPVGNVARQIHINRIKSEFSMTFGLRNVLHIPAVQDQETHDHGDAREKQANGERTGDEAEPTPHHKPTKRGPEQEDKCASRNIHGSLRDGHDRVS